jgi:hypothetical protein
MKAQLFHTPVTHAQALAFVGGVIGVAMMFMVNLAIG